MKKGLLAIFIGILSTQSPAQTPDTLDVMIGQMIMIGLGDFSKLNTDAVVFDDIRAGKVGGVILFEKNLSAKHTDKNLREILDYAQKLAEVPLLVSIDEEGGRVNRLKPKYGYPPTKTAQALGEMDHMDSTFYYARQTAGLLYKLGINMNFAPSVDVNINPENPVIGGMGRSFSGDHEVVTRHARQVIEAHELFGVATVLKHFPGHGSSKKDTHLGIADVSTTWQFEELYPYKALIDSGKVRAIMTAHIVNYTLDESKLPATLSSKVVDGILRKFMGYEGVIISDDMQMGAISKEYGLEDAIKNCILAGVDILLFANNVPDYNLVTANQIHGIIRRFVETGAISEERIKKSYQRITNLKTAMSLQ